MRHAAAKTGDQFAITKKPLATTGRNPKMKLSELNSMATPNL
jgi:hypothetical protein